MIFAAVLLIACSAAYAVPADRCVVGEWSKWSACKHGLCPAKGYESWHMSDAKKAEGKGRDAMDELMRLKNAARRQKMDCLAKGSCPEFLPRASEGFTACVAGFAGQWPCNNVDLLAFIDWTDLGFGNDVGVEGNDMWVWHDTANGEDYALMGCTHGTSFIRITNPLAPEVLAVLRTHTLPSTWRDMKVVQDHAYIVSEAAQHGMQVFDLTRLRGLTPTFPVPELAADAHYGGFGNCHNIAANTDLNKVYCIGATRDGTGYQICAGGLHMVDVSDPKNPVFDQCIGFDGYIHDTECIVYDGPDTRYTGRHICYGFNEDSLTIYDVDAGETGLISRMEYTGARYTHQGWATEDRKWVLLDDELDEYYSTDRNTKTYVWNVEDLQNPVLTHTFVSTETSIDHNLYIVGNYAYQSNYEAGLRILNIESATGLLSEAGYFDVFPSRTTAQFFGSWSNYPWLADNTVGVTSIDYGFFLVRFNQPAAQVASQGEQHRYRRTVYGREADACPALVERRECTPTEC